MTAQKRTRALVLLTSINYLNYIDRYILAAVLASIKADLSFSDYQCGLLATVFMFPYMFTSPIFGWLGDKAHRSKILSLGVSIWSVASLLTGQASQFLTMAASRFLLGIGESAFTVISVPYISDYFPSEKRGRVLSIFSTALPVGAALGFVLGGVLANWFGWRNAFFLVGAPGLILAFFVWRLPDPGKTVAVPKIDFLKSLKGLMRSKDYTLAVLGYCAYTFVVGGVALWIPTYIQRSFALSQVNANMLFGGIAVVSGFFGTLIGGFLGDKWASRRPHGHMRISSLSMFLALPFYVGGILSANLIEFAILLSLAQFFFFISTSPINVTIIEAAPKNFRTSAMAISIFAIHLLGDAISSPIIGLISDYTGSLQMGMMVCSPIILLSALFWLWAARQPAPLAKD